MSPEDDTWTKWGPAPTPREYFERRLKDVSDDVVHERELREKDWRAHADKHAVADREQEGTDERLNDVRLRFIPREVFEARLEAISRQIEASNRLALGLLVMTIAALGGVIATLATR